MDPRQVPFSQVGRAFSRSHAYQRTILIGGSRLRPWCLRACEFDGRPREGFG